MSASYKLLRKAVTANDSIAVKNLIEAGVNVNEAEDFDEPFLVMACRDGYTEVVDLLLEAKADLEKTSSRKQTPLALAANRGHFYIVKKLVEAKANIETTDSLNNTPLIQASSSYGGHPNIVEYLVDRKANVNAKNSESGKTALSFAVSNHYLKVMPFLRDSLETKDLRQRTPLLVAIDNGDIDSVKYLVLAGADINAMYPDIGNALKLAEYRQQKNIVEFLNRWIEASQWIAIIAATIPVSTPLSKLMVEYALDIQLFPSDKTQEPCKVKRSMP